MPSDLKPVPTTQQFVAPPSNAGLGTLPPRVTTQAGNATDGIPSAQDPLGMHIERDGDRRWLVVDGRTPEQLWPILKEFWQENGFSLKTDAPSTGIMATDWAENRANIPDDWFRRTIGKVIDFAYSSGTRDRFRTLVNRTSDGNTDISITHSAMEEMMVGPQGGTSSRWEERPRNPVLEAVFLSKLMQKFGLTDAQAKQLLTDARPATAPAQVSDTSSGGATLQLAESFDRAWLRVGCSTAPTSRSTIVIAKGRVHRALCEHDGSSSATACSASCSMAVRRPRSRARSTSSTCAHRATAARWLRWSAQTAKVDNSSDAQRIISLLHAQLN